jgi:DNA-binding IclR family transcriptional regulator
MKRVRGTLERYIRILEALALAPAGMTLNEIIASTKLPRGTVHRLVESLTKVGFLTSRVGRSKTYVLGPRLLRLLYSGLSSDLVVALARPFLEDLANEYGETVLLARLNGNQVEKLAAWAPREGKYSYVQPGRIMPINAAASAKAIFAFQDKAVIDEALSGRMVRYTPNTKTSKSKLRTELAEVKRGGFAVCRDEFDPGVLSYSCPVHLAGFGTLYSIGIVGLTERLGRHAASGIVAALRARCDALSLALYSRVKGTEIDVSEAVRVRTGNGGNSKSSVQRKSAPETGPASITASRSAVVGLKIRSAHTKNVQRAHRSGDLRQEAARRRFESK